MDFFERNEGGMLVNYIKKGLKRKFDQTPFRIPIDCGHRTRDKSPFNSKIIEGRPTLVRNVPC